jgi:hypothetical protein
LKLASQDNDKHVEIERLELSELAETAGQDSTVNNHTIDSKVKTVPN